MPVNLPVRMRVGKFMGIEVVMSYLHCTFLLLQMNEEKDKICLYKYWKIKRLSKITNVNSNT